ncbi:MAG TPA: YadA C-terminal domain-containing protein, partial [Rhodanobacteraceae bacterium]|nr:YadA C-terminal domain-containing protein [Rhodanobacteraceae bacterium]
VDQLDDRIGRVAALGAAMSMTSPDARINKDNQVGMGVGTYRNHSALGIGYSHLIGPSASVRAGIAIGGGGDNSAGVGVNFGW